MYRKMLVLLDGSQLAEVVFPYAKELAGRLDLDVILLHVYGPPGQNFAPMYKAYLDRTAETIKVQARQLQASFGKPVARPVEVSGELKMGYHADEILRYADENAIDLILMASHGRSGVKRWTMGGVADKILRASRVPVWLVHVGDDNAVSYDQWPGRTLLVPLSGSDVSAAVIPLAKELARQRGDTRVVLLQVAEPPAAPSYYSPELTGVPLNWGQFVEQEMARSKETAQKYLAEIENGFTEAGLQVTSLVLTGKPAEEIIAYANKNPFTVVVMATHGRSGLRRLVYGSVAESVLFGITNPIVCVRPQ
jgi:nucleotide-binding universal stress UspA family protein